MLQAASVDTHIWSGLQVASVDACIWAVQELGSEVPVRYSLKGGRGMFLQSLDLQSKLSSPWLFVRFL